ncbi:MAG: hypothetical protein ACYC69_17280 [Thermodesulfovibrionales bacterium]
MNYRKYLIALPLACAALFFDSPMVFGDQGAVLQKPAKVTMIFNATDTFSPGGKDLSSNEQRAEYLLSYPMPPMPGPSYRCVRADVFSYPQGNMGGEIATKGCCNQDGCVFIDINNLNSLEIVQDMLRNRLRNEWPLKTAFTVNKSVEQHAFSLCKKEWYKRMINPAAAYVTYTINTTYQGITKIRYCHLNMTPTTSSGGAVKTWSTDCAQDNIQQLHTIDFPLEVTCSPQPIKAVRTAAAYGYSCSQNGFVVRGTTGRSTNRMTPIPQPIPANTCVPLPEVQSVIMQTCPAGYVIRGTNLNAKQTTSQQPETCVWPTPAGQIQTQSQYVQQQLAHPGKTAQVTTQYQYTCPANYVIPGTTAQVMSYPGTKAGLTCEPKPGLAPQKADIWLEWRHTCSPGMAIHGSPNNAQEVSEILPQLREVYDKFCLPSYAGKACPFIFTRESPEGEWLPQGTILTHHNGKDQEKTDVVGLGAFSGSILIREIDPETSYIDSLSVVLYYADGSREVLLPDKDELMAADGNYLVTNQGDDVVVGFGKPSRTGFVRAEAVASGYYEPY